jgi:hypothetical protein
MRFEIRMTACNRPTLLKRALESIRAQAYTDWNAIVYDDSTDTSSRDVIDGIGDARIVYRRNPQRLGAVRNVDQCFSPEPVFGGAYACLLEDDNFWLPGFLPVVVKALSVRPWTLVQTNQRLANEAGEFQPAEPTTRGLWLPEGRVSPHALRATLLFMEGLSNSGLVWRLGGAIDLRVADLVAEPGLNEPARSLLIGEEFLFIPEPLGVYTTIEKARSARANDRSRMISRGMQRIRDYLLAVHGASLLPMARLMAARSGRLQQLIESLAYSGYWQRATEEQGSRLPVVARAYAKGLAIRMAERDPCRALLLSGRVARLGAIDDRCACGGDG